MTERVIDRITDIADQMREQAWEAEKIGQLTDQTVKAMKSAGSIRLLQPAEFNGFEVHPREFAETVMATATLDPSAGWINGVVGVHPYQLAYADPRVAEEIWADDTDTWIASPYAPQGVAVPTDGSINAAAVARLVIVTTHRQSAAVASSVGTPTLGGALITQADLEYFA